VIANRTFDKGADLAKRFGASAIPLNEAKRYLERVDIVLTSVGGGGQLISRSDLVTVRAKRRYRPIVLIDLSVPRVIDTSAQDLDGIFLFDIDDLSQIVLHGMKQRKQAATLAEQIIETETELSWKMIQGEIYNTDIGQIYQQTEELRQQELTKFLSGMNHLPNEDRQAIEKMTRALTQKLLHHPITVAKNCAREAEYDRLRFLLEAMTIRTDTDPTKK
jgi:glutamyl-tRNA reductase